MKCVILDFCTNNVDIVTVPDDVVARINWVETNESEDDANYIIEAWLSSTYRVDDISYMYGEDMGINFK